MVASGWERCDIILTSLYPLMFVRRSSALADETCTQVEIPAFILALTLLTLAQDLFSVVLPRQAGRFPIAQAVEGSPVRAHNKLKMRECRQLHRAV